MKTIVGVPYIDGARLYFDNLVTKKHHLSHGSKLYVSRLSIGGALFVVR